jgi:hypothetical protein
MAAYLRSEATGGNFDLVMSIQIEMMIELMGRGFAPIASVLSFIAVGKHPTDGVLRTRQHCSSGGQIDFR